MLDDDALKDDQPKCSSCRMKLADGVTPELVEGVVNARIALGKAKVKSIDELTAHQISTFKMMGILTDEIITKLRELDEDKPTSEGPV